MLGLEELKSFSEAFEGDVFEAISLKACVERRLTTGAPGIRAMEDVIKINKDFLARIWTKEQPEFNRSCLKGQESERR